MRDDDLTFAERVGCDLRDVRWPAPAEIRARARRRTIRTAVVTPTVLALVFAGGWAALAGRPVDRPAPAPADSATPTPAVTTPAATPSPLPTFVVPGDPAWIGPEALLQPEDVGPGMRLHGEDSFEPRERQPWTFDLTGTCPAYAGLRVTAHQRYRYLRIHTVERVADYNGLEAVEVEVERYSGRGAQQVLADMRKVASACARSEYDSPEDSTPSHPARAYHRWAVLSSGFAGDESLLVRHERFVRERGTGRQMGDHTVTLLAVVRVGDLVTVLSSGNRTEARMRELARSAAHRMCAAADPPC
ncbi:hypothetical protein [Micromonospora sp. DT47]|uniref:hypothetical protein n=1 Tax=Micromonospora sp. DT47 TaxID=3393431 RepID=UPI003CEDD50A